MNKYLIIIVIISVVFFCSCSSGKKNDQKILRMEFSFDSTRVEAEYKIFDTTYSINPPAGMKYVNDQLQSMSDILQQLPFAIDSLHCSIFLNKDNKSLLFINIAKQSLAARQDIIQSSNTLPLQSQTEFLKDDLSIHQLVYSDARNMMLILLHEVQDTVIEFNFIIPLNVYNSYSRNIESAISSIKKIKGDSL
jgi:hypothetical protein